MALSKEDRISISKQIIGIPQANANADNTIAQIEGAKVAAEEADASNKSLMDNATVLVDPYQTELTLLDGNVRSNLTEQMIIDSANHVFQSFFFPNDPATLLPSVPDGAWKSFPPFAGSAAIGKEYTETYPTTAKEQDKIDVITPIIASLDANNTETQITTGQECIEGDLDAGTCAGDTPPGATDEATCLLNGGTWTSIPTDDEIIPKADTHSDIASLKSAIADFETHLNSEKTALLIADGIDENAGRNTTNGNALTSLDAMLTVITDWNLLPDFYTGHTATDCPEFLALDPSTFPPTKLASAEFTILKNEITTRTSYQSVRLAELVSATYLGSIQQDLATGAIVAADGFYGNRFRVIDMRINLMAGSLTKVLGLTSAQDSQGETKDSNASAEALLTSVVSASGLRAPASGTPTIHVLDGSLFSIGDVAYVIAESQEEIPVNIANIQDNTVFLDVNIPKKYRETEGARLYKVL